MAEMTDSYCLGMELCVCVCVCMYVHVFLVAPKFVTQLKLSKSKHKICSFDCVIVKLLVQ